MIGEVGDNTLASCGISEDPPAGRALWEGTKLLGSGCRVDVTGLGSGETVFPGPLDGTTELAMADDACPPLVLEKRAGSTGIEAAVVGT